MGANISLNGVHLGTANDQFLRFVFPVTTAHLLAANGGAHELTVAFDTSIDCGGRWMACTGGWDWAPYSYTKQGGANTFTKGIWKSVYMATVGTAAITHVVPHVFYNGTYPTEPLTDSTHAGFTVSVTVHLWAPAPIGFGVVGIAGEWGTTVNKHVTLAAGDNKVTVEIEASKVKLWWPNGMGKQNLYNVTAQWLDSASGVSASRRIGFRFVALVTGNDTDPSYVAASKGAQGTDHLGMLFRVNGAAIFARGANMIPVSTQQLLPLRPLSRILKTKLLSDNDRWKRWRAGWMRMRTTSSSRALPPRSSTVRC